MSKELIYSEQDMIEVLDLLLAARNGEWWDDFFSDTTKSCPFFVDKPDENLVSYLEQKQINIGRVLELGCGKGRNAVHLAHHGCQVDAVDFSHQAIVEAEKLARKQRVDVNFICESILELQTMPKIYDFVYDSGCFHHLAPHRRKYYVETVAKTLKSNGRFGLVCFSPDGGSDLSDLEVYERRGLGGGLGYSEQKLRDIFSHAFEIIECRKMKEMGTESPFFGKDFLWVVLMKPRSMT